MTAGERREEILDTALRALRAGLSVVPPLEDGSKAPDGKWKTYQERRPTESELQGWYANGRTGLGIVCGQVSGGLEVLDFDEPGLYQEFKLRCEQAGLGEVLERVEAGYCEHSPKADDCRHLLYRCEAIPGNLKLACRPKRFEEKEHERDNVQVLVETRGEGGYIVTAPSSGRVHPTGRPYVLLRGGFETIDPITAEERAELHRIARTFDAMPRQEGREERPPPARGDGELRPGDDFNARTTWPELLEPHGWARVFERGGETYWRRPGKAFGISATTNYKGFDLLYVFSTSAPFETERGYDRFGAYAILNHGGALGAAARALADRGFGSSAGRSNGQDLEPPPHDDADAPPSPRGGSDPGDQEINPPREPRLRFLQLDADAYVKDEAPEPLVEHLLWLGSLHELYARAKSGKTFAALQLALCVATGTDFLGRRTRKAGVLYLSGEVRAGVVRQRIQSIVREVGIEMPAPADLRICAPYSVGDEHYSPAGFHLTCEEDFEELRRDLLEMGPGALLVIDTASSFLPTDDQNDPRVIVPLFAKLRRLAQETRTAIVLLDHPSKGQFADGPTGTVQKQAQSSVLIELKRVNSTPITWEIDVQGHFGELVEKLVYARPTRPDGTAGIGCVSTTTKALDWKVVSSLFEKHGQEDAEGRRYFESQAKLKLALEAQKLIPADSKSESEKAVRQIERELCAFEDDPPHKLVDAPIRVTRKGTGKTTPKRYTWVHAPSGMPLAAADEEPIL